MSKHTHPQDENEIQFTATSPDNLEQAETEPARDLSQNSSSQKMNDVRKVSLFGNSRFGLWFDNYWYHYKFQTLAALFVLVVTLVCIVQCATKPKSPDFSFCYAGSADLRPTSSNTIAADMESSLSPYATLALEDKDALVSVVHYLIRTDATSLPSQDLTRTNIENLQNELDIANSYIFLLDESLYNKYAVSAGGTAYMTEVAPYLSEDSSVQMTPDGHSVYLHSTVLSTLPGFSSLPDDTVLCLRVKFSLSSLSASKQDRVYSAYESLFRLLLTSSSQPKE